MEAGFNGQCLAVGGDHCCTGPDAESGHQPDADQGVSLADSHDHCFGCSDQPAHHQQAAQSSTAHSVTARTAAGCLYSLATDILDTFSSAASTGQRITPHRIRELPLLHARTTCLLI
jgi:hypothetical protein